MGNTVYTRGGIRAIIEETRLNADPSSNHFLYQALRETREILKQPGQSITVGKIHRLEQELARYPASYAARHCQEELYLLEARRIMEARDVFDLERVAGLRRDLGKCHLPEAREYKARLNELLGLVQDARDRIDWVRPFPEPQVKTILRQLRPYARRSTEISEVHQLLAEQVRYDTLSAAEVAAGG